jgi:actin-like ATPase involved in cell morphogenesis
MNSLYSLYFIILILSFIDIIQSRGVWKRKRRDDDDIITTGNNVDVINEMKKSITTKKMTSKPSSVTKSIDADSVLSTINAYMNQIYEFVETPEFLDLMTPELIDSMLQQFQAMSGASPELNQLSEVLNSPQLKDPIMIKATS